MQLMTRINTTSMFLLPGTTTFTNCDKDTFYLNTQNPAGLPEMRKSADDCARQKLSKQQPISHVHKANIPLHMMNQTPKHSFSRNVVSYTHTCYSSTNQTSPKPWEVDSRVLGANVKGITSDRSRRDPERILNNSRSSNWRWISGKAYPVQHYRAI